MPPPKNSFASSQKVSFASFEKTPKRLLGGDITRQSKSFYFKFYFIIWTTRVVLSPSSGVREFYDLKWFNDFQECYDFKEYPDIYQFSGFDNLISFWRKIVQAKNVWLKTFVRDSLYLFKFKLNRFGWSKGRSWNSTNPCRVNSIERQHLNEIRQFYGQQTAQLKPR